MGRRDAVIDCALLTSPDGAMLEVQEAHNPVVRKTPEEYNSYFVTGMRELAFRVDDIDGWFEKVKAARLPADDGCGVGFWRERALVPVLRRRRYSHPALGRFEQHLDMTRSNTRSLVRAAGCSPCTGGFRRITDGSMPKPHSDSLSGLDRDDDGDML